MNYQVIKDLLVSISKNFNYESIRTILLNFLKSEFVKLALKKVLGSVTAGGIKGWIIQYVAENLYEEVFVPFFKFLEDNGMVFYDKKKGSVRYQSLQKAKENNDQDSYDSSVDDILG